MVKYKINRLYKAHLTVQENPAYAPNSSFIKKSDTIFIFEKNGDVYTEVFTEERFDEAVRDIADAKRPRILINPIPIGEEAFKKAQRKDGEVLQLQVVPAYNSINDKGKKLVKTRKAA